MHIILGDRISEKPDSTYSLMISSGEIVEAFDLNNQGITYKVALDQFSKKVNYISTDDLNFETEEGLKVGTTFKDAQNKTNSKLSLEVGFAYILQLDSGWNAAFIEDSLKLLNKLDDNITIKFFFKRESN
ncbi:unnamed protein product, partial [Chrysoparadoxa australica]